ncbi:trypco2 family protein [Streptosporangium sp. NPDC000396]|uniref:trypco2 family protein n=1 Tax=Streptosporangium sp. NPDC000396 TaxID=3366185 RepID=UPI00369C7535
MDHEPLSLADAMNLMRGEIGKARIQAEVLDEEVRFIVGVVEAEFLVQIFRDGKDELKLGVVEAAAPGGEGRGEVQRVVFHLAPSSTEPIVPPPL